MKFVVMALSMGALLTCSSFASAPRTVSGPQGRARIPALIIGGANNHDSQWTTPSLQRILEESGLFEVDVAHDPAAALQNTEDVARYRVFVLDYNGPRWGDKAEEVFIGAVRNGVGVAVIHAADNAFADWPDYRRMVGYCWQNGVAGHGRFHPFDIKVVDHAHPITRNLADLRAHPDELYHRLTLTPGADVRVLATAYSSPESGGTGNNEPMLTAGHFGMGRIFHTMLGHVWAGDESSRRSHTDPQFRHLVVLGTEWAATGETTDGSEFNQLTGPERAAGWETLFDGTSTAKWRGFHREDFPEKGWNIENGALRVVAGGGGGDILTRDLFADFELQLDFKVSPGANSGIMYRVSEDREAPWHTGPEYQILDDSAYPQAGILHMAGALYGILSREQREVRPIGEYSHARIVLRGNHLEHWLNYRQVVSCEMNSPEWNAIVAKTKFAAFPDFGKHRTGHIDLQDHGHDVWFRNIKIRRLADISESANSDDKGHQTALFNGKDLAGWTCFLSGDATMDDVWTVDPKEGVLICKGSPAGYIRTVADYTDFVLELDWRFSPVTKKAGNSGVLLRIIGEDKVWPKCLEAQLQSGSAGDFWVIEKLPAQTSPLRTEGRHAKNTHSNENPIGEWNHYRIIADGDHVVLEVNGQVLNEAFGVLEVPGKIALQSEGTEIHFRNIRLQRLPSDPRATEQRRSGSKAGSDIREQEACP